MPDRSDISDRTRRAVLRGAAGTLGIAAMGSASAHDWGGNAGESSGNTGGTHERTGTLDTTKNAANVGYHSLCGTGPESRTGRPEQAHHGGVTEVKVHGDYAYVGFFSAYGPTSGRGLAVVDVSDYNDADSRAEAEDAEMSVVSFLRNTNSATAVMDVKVSDDGNFVFLGTQPLTALFGTTSPGKNEARDPVPSRSASSTSGANTGGVVAVDVSDPHNPQFAGAADYFSTGIHNVYHHRIGGEDYVFACKDIQYAGDAGLYVFRFDRATGQLSPVSRWTPPSEPTTERGPLGTFFYCHDVEVQDDPRTGTPTAYVSYWGGGLRVLDVSDPASPTEVGRFDMPACHFATPAPGLVDGKRVAIASQEVPSSSEATGYVNLVDADGLYERDGVTQLSELDDWVWQTEQEGDGVDDLDFANFTLSPHNSDFVRAADGSLWLHQAHYHGGVRYLKVVGSGDDLGLDERGFSRPVYDVPDDSKMRGLTGVTPNVWGTVVSNGITFASDINQGLHAVHHEEIPVTGATPFVEIERSDDGDVFTGGDTNQVELTATIVEDGESVHIRDRIPENATVAAGDDYTTYEEGGSRFVEFETTVTEGDSRTYFVEMPEDSGVATMGPAEISVDGEHWTVPKTASADSGVVAGASTEIALAGVGFVGALASQRDRLAGALGDLLN